MADNTNTITTIFKANIDQFSSSTQDMRKYMARVNAEFNEATADLGKFSDSTDGLKAKLTQLKGTLQVQQKQLKSLEDQYNSLTDEQKKNSAEGQRLGTAILNQQAKVKKTEASINDYSDSLKELEDAGVSTRQELDALTDSTKKNGNESSNTASKIAKGLGKGLLGIATAMAGAVTGFLALGESTRETRKELGQLETAFNQSGHSSDVAKKAYEDFSAVLGDTGKATESLQQLAHFAKSEQELTDYTDILTGVFARFGESIPTEGLAEGINHTIQLGEVQGTLADALEFAGVSVEDFNAQLANCTTEEERSALIRKTLNGFYGESAKQYKEVNADIIEAQKAQTRLNTVMAELGAIAEPIMTTLKNAFADLLESITPFVKLMGEGLKGAFEGSAEGAKTFADGLTGIVDTLLQKITGMLPSVLNVILELIPSLIDSLLGALPNIISTLATMVSSVVSSLGELLPQIVQSIIDTIPLVVQSIVDALPQLLEAVSALVMGIVEALPTLVESLVANIDIILNTIINAVVAFIPQLTEAAITLFMAIVNAIPTIIEALVPQLPTIVNTIINGLLSMLPALLQASVQLLMAIVQAIPTIVSALANNVPKIVSTIVTTLTSRIGDIINGAIQLFMGIIQAIPTICAQLIANMPQIISSIVSGLTQGIGDVFNVGVELIKGLWNGIKSMASWIGDKIASFGKSIVNGFKKVFNIHSPSKVMEDTIGKNLALGIGEGFDDEMGNVSKNMNKSLGKIKPALSIDTSSLNDIGSYSKGISNDNGMPAKIAEMVKGNQSVTNNYSFEYKFDKMETSQLALHKAVLETKRALGG